MELLFAAAREAGNGTKRTASDVRSLVASAGDRPDLVNAFRRGLAESGYVEGLLEA